MKIIFEKINPAFHLLTVRRQDGSSESVQLHSETYFLHDLCHFVVETELGLKEGFWGMLADGCVFGQLSGKTNELTAALREIEKIVGATQSRYWGNTTGENLHETLESSYFKVPVNYLDKVLPEIDSIARKWKYLPVGEKLELVWKEET